MKSIDELVGSSKHASDLRSSNVRIRYTVSQTVNSGQYMRHTLPKKPDEFCDMRSLRLRFQLKILSADSDCCIDAPTALSLFNRVRVLSGSQVLMDVINSHVYTAIEENIHGSTIHENKYDQYLRGHGTLVQRKAWAASEREYIIPFQRGSILNTGALLPLYRMSDLHIELWCGDGSQVLHSPLGDPNCGFVMSNIELHANYLSSKSISSFFATRPVQFHITDVSHRFNNCVGQTSLLKFSSAHTSLTKIITLLRDNTTLSVAHPDRVSLGVSAQIIDKFQLFVNSARVYDVDVDSTEQMWRHFVDAFQPILQSVWFDQDYEKNRFLLVNNLTSAPADFSESIISGIKTSAHNSDTALQIQFRAPPINIVADSFLLCDALISLPMGKSDLMLQY